jgi:uncharacterized protein YbcC (UPF0753/DUF2309 family)
MSTETEAKTETHGSVETDRQKEVLEAVKNAASCVGKAWPLHSFVTANPLAGFEDEPFHEATERAKSIFGAKGYPEASVLRKALEDGRIEEDILRRKLSESGYGTELEPARLLDGVDEETETTDPYPEEWEEVDAVLTKWLAVFFDQGRAEWSMPNREEGFYAAWRGVARYDGQLPDAPDLPDSPVAAVETFVSEYPKERWESILRSHFASLPGWTALVRWRAESDDAWQSEYPITLVGYLAVRLAVTDALDAPIGVEVDDETKRESGGEKKLLRVWLEAWEQTHREKLTDAVSSEAKGTTDTKKRPDAQLVFCIDTRSEVIRRHIEKAGDYETHGYAGFFGIPMRYEGYDSDVAIDSHPPILKPEHRVYERPEGGNPEGKEKHDLWSKVGATTRRLAESLETNAATAFSYVEKAGIGYGAAMTARTLLPSRVYDVSDAIGSRLPGTEEFCTQTLDEGSCDSVSSEDDLPVGMSLGEKVEYAATAFELMGWEDFARLVVFAGHASQTTNNPFGSALDCGACAANPGGPNARVLAAICNDEKVRDELRDRGIEIPDDTVFVAGEHNTTTDEITLFDGNVPGSHREDVEDLREDLREAREGAAAERAGSMRATEEGTREVERRAADWAETRPEWGLAGNSSFVIGPRELTSGVNLDGRTFLHSYDPSTDPDGDALEAIMSGPMVVTQWINSQYYFASVDNSVYGSGSKVTQNPVGNFGVFQGNGGDVMTGLPLQSLDVADDEPYHQPVRLSVVINAPTDRVREILEDNGSLKTLVENGWLRLSVIDPERGNSVVHYAESGFEELGVEAVAESTD